MGLLGLALVLVVLLLSEGLFAREMETCTRCHDETEAYPVLSILQTPHAADADPRIPFGSDGCEACHGVADEHLRPPAEGQKRIPPPVVFGRNKSPVEMQNEVCLSCHQGDPHMLHWVASNHEFAGLACVSCHKIHTVHDNVLDRVTQPQVCADCHKQQDHELRRPSRHPVRDGLMGCTDCHQPHGTGGIAADLNQPTLNETCYSCHAGKRGPFLWEHLPVREDCTTCHQPHGSVHRGLLEVRAPQLCQQCHLDQVFGDHAARMYDGDRLSSGFAAGRGCLNCHSQVHGSNHPQGFNFRR